MPSHDEPFTYHVTKDGKVPISWHGHVVTTLIAARASRFRERVETLDNDGVQLFLTRVTGNFQRGNERSICRD